MVWFLTKVMVIFSNNLFNIALQHELFLIQCMDLKWSIYLILIEYFVLDKGKHLEYYSHILAKYHIILKYKILYKIVIYPYAKF